MYAVMRRYSGVPRLIAELESKQADVKKVMCAAPGFVAYYAMRDREALATITICKDREAAEDTTRRAAEWVRDNLPAQRVRNPETIGGEVFISARAGE